MDLPEGLLKRIEAIVAAETGPTVPQGVIALPCEVTVCLPCFNALAYIVDCVCALLPPHQSLPLKLLMAENGSEDGTQLVLRDLMKPSVTRSHWGRYGFRDIVVVEVPQDDSYPVENRARMHFNQRACYQEMMRRVDTPYVLFVDADVWAPAGGVATMLEILQGDRKVGMVGIAYDFQTDHVPLGMTMMESCRARQYVERLTMKPPYVCLCRQLNEMVAVDGLKVVALSALHARHRRQEV